MIGLSEDHSCSPLLLGNQYFGIPLWLWCLLVHSSANMVCQTGSNIQKSRIVHFFHSTFSPFSIWHCFAPSLGIISNAIGQACARAGRPFEGWETKLGKNGHGTCDVQLLMACFSAKTDFNFNPHLQVTLVNKVQIEFFSPLIRSSYQLENAYRDNASTLQLPCRRFAKK